MKDLGVKTIYYMKSLQSQNSNETKLTDEIIFKDTPSINMIEPLSNNNFINKETLKDLGTFKNDWKELSKHLKRNIRNTISVAPIEENYIFYSITKTKEEETQLVNTLIKKMTIDRNIQKTEEEIESLREGIINFRTQVQKGNERFVPRSICNISNEDLSKLHYQNEE